MIGEFEVLPGTNFTAPLTAAELYLLLAGVLFHDIGRIWEGEKIPAKWRRLEWRGKERPTHGEWSEVIIEKNRAELGIPSVELAKSLAKICVFHKPPPGERAAMLQGDLLRTVVDPYGEIREPLVAALLTLADTMDGLYPRGSSLPGKAAGGRVHCAVPADRAGGAGGCGGGDDLHGVDAGASGGAPSMRC